MHASTEYAVSVSSTDDPRPANHPTTLSQDSDPTYAIHSHPESPFQEPNKPSSLAAFSLYCSVNLFNMGNGPPAQSHFEAQPLLTPLSAHALAAEEVTHRNERECLGCFQCGCTEIDERLLLGGFSNGSIVGISSDDENEVGLLVSTGRLTIYA